MTSIIRGSDDFDSADKSFAPIAVTGTTPSLNVGTYNFFDNGTLAANTTVSFASVPTEANWRYSFDSTLVSNAGEVSTIKYSRSSFGSGEFDSGNGLFFKPDGLKMYVLDSGDDKVNEYDLSTAWNVTTATFLQASSQLTQDYLAEAIFFKSDGLKMYMVGTSNDTVYEYNLSTAWDVSTISYLQSFSVFAQEVTPCGLFFKTDGTKMYVLGSSGDDVNEYNLSTAWNVTTASYLQLFSIAAQDIAPTDLHFNSDGTTMYVSAQVQDAILQYDLSTAWNVTTATYIGQALVFEQETVVRGIFMKPEGDRFYTSGFDGRRVNEYTSGTPASVTLPAAVANSPTVPLDSSIIGHKMTYEFYTVDGGTTVKLIGQEVV